MKLIKSDLTKTGVFDLNDLHDLPEKVSSQIKINKSSQEVKNLLRLFDFRKKLSIDEIIVGLYRLYGMEKKRFWVKQTLNNLIESDHLIKAGGKKNLNFEKA